MEGGWSAYPEFAPSDQRNMVSFVDSPENKMKYIHHILAPV